MSSPLIAILTDFGATEPFVGVMKGVIAGIVPQARLVDLTHAIPPGDILRGAVMLWQAAPYFPPGTIFLSVVDPGVGTPRRPLILQQESGAHGQGFTFIGPDNGLFTFVASNNYHAWELKNPALALPKPSKTFHGRDLFAPAAAHAAVGTPGADFGPEIEELVRLPLPRLELNQDGELEGEILFPDRFGNLLTSLGAFESFQDRSLVLKPWLPGPKETRFSPACKLMLPEGKILSLAYTFGEIPDGLCAFLTGSSGLMEIAANRHSAAELLGLQPGDRIKLTPR